MFYKYFKFALSILKILIESFKANLILNEGYNYPTVQLQLVSRIASPTDIQTQFQDYSRSGVL